jgi:DNA-binding NtrC family response regulator
MDRVSVKQRFSIIGDHHLLNASIDIALQVAPTDVTVLVNGENGTGKDVFSKIIHQFGKRKHQPFIAINCGAIPEGTIDSELFGHEKGSFTSAHEARKGYFEEVNGGTIFLDEIAEMPLATQSRLLRVLESGEFFRVGSSKVQKTDVRVITATNKNLLEAVAMGRFREDLFYRLNTVTIHVPPLRDRGKDIPLLFRYFASEFAHKYGRNPIRLTEDAKAILSAYRWPGNVRELRNYTEQLTVLSGSDTLNAEDVERTLPNNDSYLPVHIPADTRNGSFESERELLFKIIFDLKNDVNDLKGKVMMLMNGQMDMSNMNLPVRQTFTPTQSTSRFPEPVIQVNTPLLEESLSLERKEKDLIFKALQKYRNNRKKAAQDLGISERTLYRKIKSYGLEE